MIVTRKRSRMELIVDVLRATKQNPKPTRIMYASNLSWTPLLEILDSSVKRGLIRVKQVPVDRFGNKDERTRVTYEITEKGARILEYFKVLQEELEGEDS